MEIKSVGIIGTGAVGSYVLWGLQAKPEIDVCVIANEQRKEKYQQAGFIINDQEYHPVIKTPAEAKGVDLIIVALKYGSLKPSLNDIKEAVGENTIVMSLMNGIDSEEIIGAEIGMDKIVHSLIKVASERKDNSVRFNPEKTGGIIFGEADLTHGNERTDAITALFTGSNVRFKKSDEILNEIWGKFLLNICTNLVQSVIGAGAGVYKHSEHADYLKNCLGNEVRALASAKGIDISRSERIVADMKGVKDRARFSTLQDLDAHRHTEIDMFSGTIVKLGKELGIPTPYNDYTYHMIKALEEKNDGRFDFE